MAVNKVEANGETLIDLTNDTVQASDVLKGKTLHLASGVQVEGTYDHDSKQDTFVILWEAEGGSEGINNLGIDDLSDLIENYSALIVTISNEDNDSETVGSPCTLASAYCHLSYAFRHGDAAVFVPISLQPTTEHPSIRNVLCWIFMDQTAHDETPKHIYVLATRDPSVSPSFLTGLYLRRIVGIPISGWKFAVLSGYLPLTFVSNGDDLSSYRIYGTSEGAGEKTKNIISVVNVTGVSSGVTITRSDEITGSIEAATISGAAYREISWYPELEEGHTYIFSCYVNEVNRDARICFRRRNGYQFIANRWFISTGYKTMEITYSSESYPGGVYCAVLLNGGDALAGEINVSELMLRPADTTPDFEPFGYKIPLTVTSGTETKDIVIPIGDSKLMAGEYVSYESTEIVPRGKIHKSGGTEIVVDLPAIEPFEGTNTLDSTVEVGEVTIKGKIKH